MVCATPTARVRAGDCRPVVSTPPCVPRTPQTPNLEFVCIAVQLRRQPVHADAITTPVPGSNRSLKPTELIPIPPARSVEGADGGKSFDVLILEVDPPRLVGVGVGCCGWLVMHTVL